MLKNKLGNQNAKVFKHAVNAGDITVTVIAIVAYWPCSFSYSVVI